MKKISGLKFIKGIPIDHGKRTSYMLEGPPRSREDRIAQIDMEEAESLDLCTPAPELAKIQNPIETVLRNLIHAQEMNLTQLYRSLEQVLNDSTMAEASIYDLKGIAPNATGDMSSEDFVAKNRAGKSFGEQTGEVLKKITQEIKESLVEKEAREFVASDTNRSMNAPGQDHRDGLD
jgi:hypothetical protein